MALAQIINEMFWILHIIEGMPGRFVHRPSNIFVDNKPAISLADNHAASKFTRHIGIDHHFLRDHCDGGDKSFNIVWTDSRNQKADGMTKPLPRMPFTTFRDSVVSDLEL